jgi:hypothetical protein
MAALMGSYFFFLRFFIVTPPDLHHKYLNQVGKG